jgi:ADP-ribose pyrophosphatase YjhB (NUDIX family)
VARPGDDWVVCPRCRTALERAVRGGVPRPACPTCGFVFFANPGVGAAVVVRNAAGHVLLVQRGAGRFGAGGWCFPCGFVEWGEDVRAAAAREALEEAGVVVEIGAPLQVASNFHEAERPTIGVWFAARLIDPATSPTAGDDAVAVGWFDPGAPPTLAFPTDAVLLRRLARRARRPTTGARSGRGRARGRRGRARRGS